MEEFYVDLINNYIVYYKQINEKPSDMTMFEGINFDDPFSTNRIMEKFYEEMCIYNEYKNSDENMIKIYDYKNDTFSLENMEELYGITKNDMTYKVSGSLFSLLIELTNLKNEDKINDVTNTYGIIPLK